MKPFLVLPATVLATAALASAQCELARLTAPIPSSSDDFGRGLDACAGRVLVGAPHARVDNVKTGAGYLFARSGTSWVQLQELSASDGQDDARFGTSVALDGDRALVAAPFGLLGSLNGKVYFFESTPTGFEEVQLSLSPEPEFIDRFGWDVALDGNVAVIGAPGPDRAYVFEWTPIGWAHLATLEPIQPTSTTNDFGSVVALDGHRAVVSTSEPVGPGPPEVFVFERVGGVWVDAAQFSPVGSEPAHAFGSALAIDGDRVLAGAPDDGAGAAYVFEQTPLGWVEVAKLTPPDGVAGDRFGAAVDLSGDIALIGAPDAQPLGVAYAFERVGTEWTLVGRMESSDPLPIEAFGTSVAIDPDSLWVSAVRPSVTHGRGRVEGFAIEGGERYCTATASSVGSPAAIGVTGCPSIQTNDVVLFASPVPDGNGVFFYGAGPDQVPFGDGVLCIARPFARLEVSPAAGGSMSAPLDVDAPPTAFAQITAGSSWRFQAWFRDTAAGLSGFNLSDGLLLTFQP